MNHVKPFSVDQDTVKAVKQAHGLGLVSLVLVVIYVLTVLVVNWSDGVSAFFNFIFALMLGAGFVFIWDRFVVGIFKRIRFAQRVKAIEAVVPLLGLSPTVQYSWRAPLPGLVAIDQKNKLVFLQSGGTGHNRLIFKPEHLMDVKVVQETEMHTETKESGRIGFLSSAGLGVVFGGHSSSKSKIIENMLLEIHYQLDGSSLPSWIVVPFGQNRADANLFANMLRKLML